MTSEINYCIECGKKHGMEILNRITGERTPIKHCSDCLWIGTFNPITSQIHLTEEDIPKTTEEMQRELGELMLKILNDNYGKNNNDK